MTKVKRFICIILALLIHVSVSAAGGCKIMNDGYENLIYANSFDWGLDDFQEMAGGYEPAGYKIKTIDSNRVLTLNGGMNANSSSRNIVVLAGPDTGDEFTLSVDVMTHKFISEAYSILFCAKNSASYYSLTWSQGRVPSYWDTVTNPTLTLCKNNLKTGVSTNAVYTFPKNISAFNWQTYKIVFSNGIISVYMQHLEEPVILYTDSTPIIGGQIGFSVSGSSYAPIETYFDNVKVSIMGGDSVQHLTSKLAGTVVFVDSSPLYITNNSQKIIDVQDTRVSAYNDGGSLMLPVRCLAEALGFSVGWDSADEKIVLTGSGKEIKLKTNSEVCLINGQEYTLSKRISGRFNRSYISFDDVSAVFDKQVQLLDDSVALVSSGSIPELSANQIETLIKNFGKPN